MAKQTAILLPKQQRMLNALGENIKLARKRRGLTTSQVAERAGIGRTTLYHIEQGAPGVTLGNLLRTLAALGLERDLERVASDDTLGRKLADIELLTGKSKSKP